MAKHLHLPLQSGSNTILKSMKRGYTIEQYRRIVNKINKKDPTISLTSDFIVGFPGETDADFDETMLLLKNLNLIKVFSLHIVLDQEPHLLLFVIQFLKI